MEEGIILEDDCLPNQSFFKFCEEMLERYKDDKRVMHISGDNFQFGMIRGDGDYYFSKLNHVWGWATWKRAWDCYDFDMKSLDKFLSGDYIKGIFTGRISKDWINHFKNVKDKKIDTWDYQWTYSMWSYGGLAILPNKNLVKNLGFNRDATHTKESNKVLNSNIAEDLVVSRHPQLVIRDYFADLHTFRMLRINIIKRIVNKIKKYEV